MGRGVVGNLCEDFEGCTPHGYRERRGKLGRKKRKEEGKKKEWSGVEWKTALSGRVGRERASLPTGRHGAT